MTPQGHQIPKASDLQTFGHAVAGHAGTLCDATGSLFIKPCVQAEIDFYETVTRDHPDLAQIIPLYIGSLMLHETANTDDAVEQITQAATQAATQDSQDDTQTQTPPPDASAPSNVQSKTRATSETPAEPSNDNGKWVQNGSGSIKTDRAVVLENAIHGFKHPNILDVKLGTQLYTDTAVAEKKARMKVIAEQTTHKNFGFRIAGMRVWNGAAEEAGTAAAASPSIRTENGYTIYDKDYGRKEVNDDNIVAAFRRFVFNEAAGVDEEHGRAIASAFKADLENVRDVLERERTRMFSSSLLFVFEGDGDALKLAIKEGNRAASSTSTPAAPEAVPLSIAETLGLAPEEEEAADLPNKRRRIQPPSPIDKELEAVDDGQPEDSALSLNALRATSRRVVLGKATDRSSSRTDSGIAIEDDDDERDDDREHELHMVPESFDMADEVDDAVSVSDSEASSSGGDALPPIYNLRLIDFAHARFVEQDTPDENNLLGVRKLIAIFSELCQ